MSLPMNPENMTVKSRMRRRDNMHELLELCATNPEMSKPEIADTLGWTPWTLRVAFIDIGGPLGKTVPDVARVRFAEHIEYGDLLPIEEVAYQLDDPFDITYQRVWKWFTSDQMPDEVHLEAVKKRGYAEIGSSESRRRAVINTRERDKNSFPAITAHADMIDTANAHDSDSSQAQLSGFKLPAKSKKKPASVSQLKLLARLGVNGSAQTMTMAEADAEIKRILEERERA